MTGPDTIWCFADENEEEWHGHHSTREEAIEAGRGEMANGFDLRTHFYVGEFRRPSAMQFADDAESYLQAAHERAQDEAGEGADDWPDVGLDVGKELDALLAGWCAKHLEPVPFYVPIGKTEKVPFESGQSESKSDP